MRIVVTVIKKGEKKIVREKMKTLQRSENR